MTSTFPVNPENGTIFQVQEGVMYQYDATVRAWIKMASNSVNLPLATSIIDGAMSSTDLQKLNRLMVPPPHSSITGNDCYTPFRTGVIALVSGDDLINVEGSVSVQNIDEYGDHISKDVPYQIHQHTYGFDFNLDLNNLVNELIARGQFKMVGATGVVGDKGPTGDAGIDGVLCGPQGETGDQGTAPACNITLQSEVVQTRIKQNLKRAITAARVVVNPDNPKKYVLELDRQVVGDDGASAATFNVRQQSSSWLLAVSSVAGTAQQVYYVDIEPIISSIHDKFLKEVERLKGGYEEITQFWIQTMSDLFDEQKTALCCALEACQSRTNGVQLRQHMESVAGAALPNAQIVVHERGATSTDQTFVSGTALWPSIGQPDLCGGDVPIAATMPFEEELVVDPIIHVASGGRATMILDEGIYSATIDTFDVEVGGQHYANLVLMYANGGRPKAARFLNKGSFSSLKDAKSAYEGLSVSFEHAGGEISTYFNMLPTADVSGAIRLRIRKEASLNVQMAVEETIVEPPLPGTSISEPCEINTSLLDWYQRGWSTGQCCGLVVEIYGQDYIIVKRHIDNSSLQTPCTSKFSDPAFAWPTFDKQNFAPLLDITTIFKSDRALSDIVREKIANGAYENPKGNIGTTQFDIILFPAIS